MAYPHSDQATVKPSINYWGNNAARHIIEDKEPCIHPIVKIGKKLKSIDGIDEVAQALGQILPGIAGPIATSAVLSVATPFVFMGLLGMKDEYKEACAEYKEILEKKQTTDAKLHAMAENADKWRRFLAKKLNLGIPEKGFSNKHLGELALNKEGLDNFANTIVEAETLRNKEFIARLGKKHGWTGIAGMGGMFAGMLPATASAGILIFKELGLASNAAVNAAAILSTASGAAFLGGQGAMSAYAANKAHQGHVIGKMLNCNRARFLKYVSGQIKDSTKHAVLEIIDKDLLYNKRGNIQYGAATVAGQAAMGAGTVASLTGAGAAIGIPLVAAGAPITVIAALGRIFYNHKEEKFVGDEESAYSERRRERTDLTQLLLGDEKGKNTMQTLETEFEFSSRQLAYTKLYSMMRNVLNNKKYHTYSPQQKFARLEKIISSGKVSYFSGTSLRGGVLKTVKELFSAEKDIIRGFFSLPSADANKALLANIVNCTKISEGTVPKFSNKASVDGESLKELMELTRMQDKAVYKRLLSHSLSENDTNLLNEQLVKNLKNSLKFVRHDISHKFVHMAHIEELQDVIAHENTLQQNSPNMSHAARYTSTKEARNNNSYGRAAAA